MLPQEAVAFILDHVEPGSVVVEFGSGHGSQVLSEHFDLYSFEHDEAWLGVTSSTYIHAPIVENQHATEAGRKGMVRCSNGCRQATLASSPHCVIVDGHPAFIGRTGILSMLDELASVSLILVDDVDRLTLNYSRHWKLNCISLLIQTRWLMKKTERVLEQPNTLNVLKEALILQWTMFIIDNQLRLTGGGNSRMRGDQE